MFSPVAIAKAIDPTNLMQCITEVCRRLYPDEPLRLGGALALGLRNAKHAEKPHSGAMVFQIGEPHPDKFYLWFKNAPEKLARLLDIRKKGGEDIASSQSADPDNPNEWLRSYGGCVVFSNEDGIEIYLSFSGAPPEIDEACMFVFGEMLGFSPSFGFEENIADPEVLQCVREVFGKQLKLTLPD